MNEVTKVPAASFDDAFAHFSVLLSFETDCWDVHHALKLETPGFVLVDVRGEESYAEKHIPGAINILYRGISKESLAFYPKETLFVVYCSGPHCNAAIKSAIKLSDLKRPVKVMIGGIKGWQDEGFSFQMKYEETPF